MRIVALLIIFILSIQPAIQGPKAGSRLLFPIEQKGKYGYIDETGRVVIEPKFDEGLRFSEGLAPVLLGDKWGYIDASGSFAITPQFFEAGRFSEGLASVGVFYKSGSAGSEIGSYGYIDRSGKLAIAPQFGVAFDFAEGLARIQTRDYKNGYIDKTGKVAFFDERLTEDFSDELALFKTDSNMPSSKTGYMNKSGNTAISARFDRGESFAEGVACVSSNRKSGFIDTKGSVVVDFQFDGCGSFSEGLAPVLVAGQWGYIDKSGKLAIKPKFAAAEQFSDGVAVVRVFEANDPLKAELRYKSEPEAIPQKPGKFGVVDKSGRMIIDAKFVQLGNFSDGLAWVNLGNEFLVHGSPERWGYLNKSGKLVWTSTDE